MKKIWKILLATVICICLTSGLTVAADVGKGEAVEECESLASSVVMDGEAAYIAEEEDPTVNKSEDAHTNEASGAENSDTVNEESGEAVDEGSGEADGEDSRGEESGNDDSYIDQAANENGFGEIYDLAMSYMAEILSLCAFIGSLICAIIYKSGLVPLMENGLRGIKNAAVKIKEATDRAEIDNKESMGSISSQLTKLDQTLAELNKTVTRLSEAQAGLEEQRAHRDKTDKILGGELDMLYDIFMCSALPEYEKTRVGERMAKLKEVLNSDEGEK